MPPRLGLMLLLAMHALAACTAPLPPVPVFDGVTGRRPYNRAELSADSPARLCPADVQLYMQFDGLADLRARHPDDALVAHLWKSLAGIRPKDMWTKASAALGLTEDELVDRYFGQRVAIAGERPSTAAPIAVLSQVEPEHLNQLPKAMGLKPAKLDTVTGAFQTYLSEDDKLLLAMHDRWLLVASKDHGDFAQRVLTFAAGRFDAAAKPQATLQSDAAAASALALADHDGFQDMLTKLPPSGNVLIFTHEASRKTRHAVVIDIADMNLTAHYAARFEKWDELYEQFDRTEGVDFGLMPSSAIAAFTVNLMKRDQKGIALLNLFIIPRSIREDVLPKLSAPIVVFLSGVEGSKIKPHPGLARVPAFGVAIKLKDPQVVGDLDRIMGGLHAVANVGELDLVRGLFGSRTLRRPGYTVRVSDFGEAILKQIRDEESRKLFRLPNASGLTKLYYGQIGSWYVLCSQEDLFRQCVEAEKDASKRLAASPALAQFPFESREGLMLSALVDAPQLVALTNELADYWKMMEAKGAAPDPAAPSTAQTEEEKKKNSAAHRVTQPMVWLGEAIKHRHSFHMQVWRDSDGDLQGELRTLAPTQAAK